MDRDDLTAEIKKLLQEELQSYVKPLADKIPSQQKAQAVELTEDLRKLVKDHPLLSLGLALTAGFLVARTLYRSDDK